MKRMLNPSPLDMVPQQPEPPEPRPLEEMLAGAQVQSSGVRDQLRNADMRYGAVPDVKWFGKGQPGANAFTDGTPLPLYHGTTKTFNSLRPGTGGAAGPGIYLSKEPGLANTFAGAGPGAQVKEVYARGRFMKVPFGELIDAPALNARARREGYDGLDTGIGELVVFDPQNVRSSWE